MKNKLRRDIFVIIFLLLVACIALAVPLAFSNPRWLLAPALLVVFALRAVKPSIHWRIFLSPLP